MQKICKFIMKLSGWTGTGELIPHNKCILIGVPHTSAFDFIWSYVYYTSVGGNANFLVKKEFFFWPLGFFIRKMGGMPIDRSKGANVIRQAIKLFNENEHFHMSITPEGTRKRTKNWKAGFHTIARNANVPVYLTSFDWGRKQLTIWGEFKLTDDHKEDIKRMKDFYREKGVQGRNPELFTTEY